MGWTFDYSWRTQAAAVTDLEAQIANSGYKILDRASSRAGRVRYWAVEKGGESFILVDLLEFDRREKCYGVKSMDESVGPCEKDCPLRLLNATKGLPGEFAADWRAAVRKLHALNIAAKTRQFTPGESVKIGQSVYTIVGPGKTAASVIVADQAGKHYRAPKRWLLTD